MDDQDLREWGNVCSKEECVEQDGKVVFPYVFKNNKLFEQCFKTKNYGSDMGEECYQRLEFYGDKLLDHFIAEQLYVSYKNASVGELSKMHAFIRSNNVLADIYDIYKLPAIKYGRLDSKTMSIKVRANVMEALIGGIKLDSNYDTAQAFFINYYYPKMKDAINEGFQSFNSVGKVHNFFQLNKIVQDETKIDTSTQNGQCTTSKQFIVRFKYQQNDFQFVGVASNYKEAKNMAYSNIYNTIVVPRNNQ